MPGLFLLSRILFGGFFLLSGLNHFFGLGHMRRTRIPVSDGSRCSSSCGTWA